MSTPPIVTQYAGPTPYKLTNVETNINVFNSYIPFYPNQLSDLAIWLDGKDVLGNGTPLNFGDPIPVWANKAPNAITVTQTNEEYKPTYDTSETGVVFNNTNTGPLGNIKGFNTTYGSANNSETIFILLQYTANDSFNYNLLYPSIKDGGRQLSLLSNTSDTTKLKSAILTEEESVNILTDGIVVGSPTLVSSWDDASTLIHYINGASTGSAEPLNPFTGVANTLIGTDNYEGNQGLLGTISEIIIYSNALSDSDRQKVESYLYWKWNKNFSLDPSNPYTTQAYSNQTYLYPNINSNLIPPVPRNLFSALPTLDSNNYPLIKNFIQLPNILKNTKFI